MGKVCVSVGGGGARVAEGDGARVGDGAMACGTGPGMDTQPAARQNAKAQDSSGYMINDRMLLPPRQETEQ